MKKLAIILITALFSVNTWAEETDLSVTYLCIEDDKTGFNWEGGQWVQSGFHPSKYLIKKNNNFDYLATFKFGSENSSTDCKGGFVNDELLCFRDNYFFKFSRKTGRFGIAKMTSVIDPATHLAIYGGVDSLTIAHGKCSKL